LKRHFRRGQVAQRFDAVAWLEKEGIAGSKLESLLCFMYHETRYWIHMFPHYTHKKAFNEIKDIMYRECKQREWEDIVAGGTFGAVFDVFTNTNGVQVFGVHLYFWSRENERRSIFFTLAEIGDEKAETLFRHFLRMCVSWGINPEFLVHAGMDNARTNMGIHKGFAKLLASVAPFVHIGPCLAHRCVNSLLFVKVYAVLLNLCSFLLCFFFF
jgi:hypothetical protein